MIELSFLLVGYKDPFIWKGVIVYYRERTATTDFEVIEYDQDYFGTV